MQGLRLSQDTDIWLTPEKMKLTTPIILNLGRQNRNTPRVSQPGSTTNRCIFRWHPPSIYDYRLLHILHHLNHSTPFPSRFNPNSPIAALRHVSYLNASAGVARMANGELTRASVPGLTDFMFIDGGYDACVRRDQRYI